MRRALPRRKPDPPAPKSVGRPRAPDLGDVEPVRTTIYLTPQLLKLLRVEAHRRLLAGERADVSLVVREAIGDWFKGRR